MSIFISDRKLSVSIVTYNTDFELVKKAVFSVLSACSDAKIVIADNNSGLGYFQKLCRIFKEDSRVSVVSTGSNSGYGSGHNFAVSCAKCSKFHLVMNADVEFKFDVLEKMISFLESDNEVGLVVPRILSPDGTLQALNKRNPTLLDMFLRFFSRSLVSISMVKKRLDYYEMRDVGYSELVEVPYASGCFMMFRKEAYEKVDGFDENFFMYLEDADITRRVSLSYRVVYLPDAEIVHNWSRGSYKQLKLFLVMLHSIGVYFNKWGWRLY